MTCWWSLRREAGGAFHWAKPSVINLTFCYPVHTLSEELQMARNDLLIYRFSSRLSSLSCLAYALGSWSRTHCLSSLVCLVSGCSAALRSWVLSSSLSSLPCLASGCSGVLCLWLCTHCPSSLACLTSACSDCLCFRSLWCQRCSLAAAFSSHMTWYTCTNSNFW